MVSAGHDNGRAWRGEMAVNSPFFAGQKVSAPGTFRKPFSGKEVMVPRICVLLFVFAFSAGVYAAPVDPAAEAEKEASKAKAEKEAKPAETAKDPAEKLDEEKRWHSWDAPAIRIPGKEFELKEEERIGDNEQPRWTSARRFNRTRTYVIPNGEFEFEFWHRLTTPRRSKHGDERANNRILLEAEMGLPLRFQIDMYLQMEKNGSEGPFEVTAGKFEVRWALFKWGRCYTNPTLYVEYAMNSGEPDAIECKLLLGDEICPRWHWGVNLVYEHDLGGDHGNHYAITGGLSYTFFDSLFSFGVETENEFSDNADNRNTFENEHLIGPSMQIKPLPQMHVNIVLYLGIGVHSPAFRSWIVIGWEF